MKIALISAHSCPMGVLGTKDTGGMSVYTVEIARELGKMGHTVDAFTRTHDTENSTIIEIGDNARLIHIDAGEPARLHKMDVYPMLTEFSDNLEAFRKQHELRYDIVYSHYWLSAVAGEHLSRWWGVPHVTMFHTLGAIKNMFAIGEPEPELRIDTEGELARNVHRIIAPTEREKSELVDKYQADPEKIGVVPCGVNTRLFRPIDREESKNITGLPDGKLILYAGRLDGVKGISNLIKAFAQMREREATHLVIVGGDSNGETYDYIQQAQELGIGDSVIFTGSVKQEKMPYYYSAADVCVVSSYYESFGLVALESLACGTPVVANDVGDLRNIIRQGETGYVVNGNEPPLLAEKIELILSNGYHRPEGIRESVSEYTWSNIAETVTVELKRALCGYRIPVS